MKTKSRLTPGLALRAAVRAVDGAGSARAEHGDDVLANHAELAVNAAALATTDDARPRNTSEPASPKQAASPAPAKKHHHTKRRPPLWARQPNPPPTPA